MIFLAHGSSGLREQVSFKPHVKVRCILWLKLKVAATTKCMCFWQRSEAPRQARRSTQCHISLRYKIGPLSLPPIFDWPSCMAICVFHYVVSTTHIGLYLRKCHVKQSKANNVIHWKVITYQPKCVPSTRLQTLWRLFALQNSNLWAVLGGGIYPLNDSGIW